MPSEDMDLIKEDEQMDFNDHEDNEEYAHEDEAEHDLSGELHSELEDDEEVEEDEEKPKLCSETATVNTEEIRQLDLKLKEKLTALTSREFTVRVQAAKDFRHMLREDSGGGVLHQYVQASPGCTELLEAWKLGIEGKTAISIFFLITEILKHPAGKDYRDDYFRRDEQKQKLAMYVSMRLDKFARTIVRKKIKDVYLEINSDERKRQTAALFLMAAIVRRGRTIALEVATKFDFTLKVFPELGQRGKVKGNKDDSKIWGSRRRGFIEFGMAFLEVSNPSLLRWVLQIRPLYAGVLRGLAKDDEETIVYVLGLFREKVLSTNSMVPPGLRSVLFGDAVLEQLSAISADSSLGRGTDVAHEILLMFCTDPSHGLLPDFPEQWDVSKPRENLRRGNRARLLRLMLKLKSTEVDNHRNLLLAMVTDKPLLASAYLDSFPYSLEPRVSSTWFAAIVLVSDLIRAAKVSPPFSSLAAEGSSPPSLEHPAVNSRLKCILPQSFGRAVINRGLLHANTLVKHCSLRVLQEALSSLECLLNAIDAAVENLPKKIPAIEMQNKSLSKCISNSHLVDVKGLSGIGILRALTSSSHSEENSSNHSTSFVEPLKQKWLLLKQEVQNLIRGLLPDPQVLLSLLSSLKSGSAEKNIKRKFPFSMNSKESETRSKVKKLKSDSIDPGVEIFASGIKGGDRKEIIEESVAFEPDQDSHDLDTTDEDLITAAQIWGMEDTVIYKENCIGEESILYTKILDVLALYQRTLPIAMVECSFDAFKLLPEEPLLLSSIEQQSILSLLVEYTGGLHLSAFGCEGCGLSTGQIYKYLRPILKLMLYSPIKDVRRYAHLLAYRAMLSTCAFERNKGEIEVWFSFLPVQKNADFVIQENQKRDMQDGSIGNMFGGLVSMVIEFLCDAVSTVGKNLFKFLDELQCLLSNLRSTEGLAPPHFSPLVICVLEKCLRVVESSSKSMKVSQRTMISIYVASVMNFLLQCEANSRTLAFIIVTTLHRKFQQGCQHDRVSEHFLCEWSPLRSLLLFAQDILSKEQARLNLELIDNQFSSKDRPRKPRSLPQVLAVVENTDCAWTSGVASAFASSIVSSMPEEILENFPSIVTICHKAFEKDYSVLLALFCVHKELFGRIAEAWDDVFSMGLELVGNLYLRKRENNIVQAHKFSWQYSSVDHGFNFSKMRSLTTEQELLPDSMNEMCPTNPSAIAFASFIQSIPFFALFLLSANSYQSKLLGCTSMRLILEEKLCEVTCDYINILQLILYWILRIECSLSEGVDLKKQLATCFSLLRNLVLHCIELCGSDNHMHKLDNALDMASTEELIQLVLVHPAINMFMCKSMDSSVHKNAEGLKDCQINSINLHSKKWERKGDSTSLEMLLHLCEEKVNVIDNNILHMLMTLLEFITFQDKVNQGCAVNHRDSVCKAIVGSSKSLILRSITVLKNELVEMIKSDSYEICPLPSFYVLSVLSPFLSPFNLLKLVHWLFSNDICEGKTIPVLGSNISFLDVGLYFGTRAFEMFSAYLNQSKENACIQRFFWDMDGQMLDANLVREVYVKMIEVAIKQNSKSADRCLLTMMKALHVQTDALITPQLLPIRIMFSNLTSIIPPELIQHCTYNTNQLKMKIMLLLTQISNLHLSIYGELIVASMNIHLPARHLLQLDISLEIVEKFLEEKSDTKLSENELLLLLPITLRYLSSNLSIIGSSFLESSKNITAYYFSILWKGFMKWDELMCSEVFNTLEYDEGRCMNIEDYACFFKCNLLVQAVCMLKAFPTSEKTRKRRRKLFTSILPKINCPLDHRISDISVLPFKELLNMVNRIIAKASLARWLLFPKSGLDLHVESNFEGQLGNDASNCSSGKGTEFDDELKMELADYGRFINCLICTLDAIFKHFSLQSCTLGDMENRNRANLLNFLERSILNHLVDVSKEIGVQSIKIEHLPSLKAFTKSTFLHRFENCMVLRTLRCLLILLLQEDTFSDIIVTFAEDALRFLMAHSQFVLTILSTSCVASQSLGQSDKGTMFRSLTGILNLLQFSSLDQHENPRTENMIISPHISSGKTVENITPNKDEESFSLEKRKLEVVKLLRVLYLLRVQQGVLSVSGELSINAKELFSLLLAGYGATMDECDLQIFSLMHEIESFSGSSFSGLSEMNYLWGEAALKRRRQQHDERLLSEYNPDDKETTEERQKRDFRENLLIDPKVCGETILFFPFTRSAWGGPIEMAKFAEESLKEITLEIKSAPSLHGSSIVCYDPAFILEFSIHALSVGYIESGEFARLGLLALAFASLSSADESMRKLAYGVLGKYTQNLENGRNFKGRPQLLLLLTHVKNAIVEPWQKIPSLLAIFAAEASCILMDPTNNYYPTINRLLMRSPAMVLESIPLLHSMFGSGSVHYQNDRIWILRLLAAGLNLSEDSQIYRRKFVVELLMSFYGSPLSDFRTRWLVLQVLKKAVKIRELAQYLVEHAGMLLWLSSAVLKCTESQSRKSVICFTSIVLEMIHNLLSWRSITKWLLTNGFEQLSQTASCLLGFLTYNSSLSGQQATFIKYILHVLTSILSLSRQRKLYQSHFCLGFEGLFQVIQLIEHRDPVLTLRDIVELGVKVILGSSPPAVNTIKDKVKLLKLGMWSISGTLQTSSLASLHEEIYADKHWKSVQHCQEALMENLLRWLVASVILGKISRAANQPQIMYHSDKPNLETLFSLLIYLKTSSCLSEMEYNPEVNKGLAQLILYLHQLVGVRCRVLPSVVAAVSLLLLPDGTNFIDGTSWHNKFSSLLALLLSEVSCPVEVNPSWRWSSYFPWKDRSSKFSDMQKLWEYEVCQILLKSFRDLLSGTTLNFNFILFSQKVGLANALPDMRNELCDKFDVLKAEICKISSNMQDIELSEKVTPT